MNGILKDADVVTIETAIVLASSGVFDGAADGRCSTGALTRVGGMTLLQRTLCALQRGGISQARILVGEEEQALRSLIHGDTRIRMELAWLPVREWPPWHCRTWEAVTREIQGACLILGCHIVFPPSLIAALREEGREGNAIVTVGPPGERGWVANPGVRWRFAPHHRDGRVPRVVFADHCPSDLKATAEDVKGLASAVDLVVVPVRFFGAAGTRRMPGTGETCPVRLALERAAAEDAVRVLSASAHGYQDIRKPGGPRHAERMLFHGLQHVQGKMDGVMDRYVNRKLSRVFSRLFLRLRCSPTVITVLSLMLGLLGAACFAMGSYRTGLVGAVLFQVAVILDCCDGDVARLTFAESTFGQTLDIVADNIVHMAIFAGIAWGAYQEGVWHASPLPLLVGAVAIVANGVALWGVQRVRSIKAHAGHWRQLNLALRSRFDFVLERVANRDFSVVVMVCACVGALPWFLWLGAAGASVFAFLMVWNLRQALRSYAS